MLDRDVDGRLLTGAAEALTAAERLGRRQRWALVVIAALALVGLAIAEFGATNQTDLINIAGRQRMLQERTVKETLLVAQAHDPTLRELRATRLGVTINEWRSGLQALRELETVRSRVRSDMEFNADLEALTRAQEAVLGATQQVVDAPSPESKAQRQLIALDSVFVTAMDEFIDKLVERSKRDDTKVTQIQALLLLVATLLLAFVALLRPQQSALTRALRTLDARHRELHAEIATAEASQRRKARFLATMSHELRNPLSGIIGIADLLDHTRLDDAQKAYVGGLRTASNHLLGLINNVLDYSRIDSGKLELERGHVDPRACVHEVLQMTEALAQNKDIDLRAEIAPATPARFIGDATRLRQILLNLVSNAIKFTERGTVTLATAVEDDARSRATLIFRVSDTGAGVPPERLPSLFDTFTQVDAKTAGQHGGSGLGLAIVRRLAKAMRGELTATSTPGEGSTFALRLPFEIPNSNTSPSWPHTSMSDRPPLEDFASDHPRRILAVEDEPVNRMVLGAMLNELGYTPTMASSGREALQALDTCTFDLVLTDMRMPELDGVATTQAIRERLGDASPFIIAVTATPESETAQTTDEFDAYLGKPVTLGRLKEAIAGSREPARPSSATPDTGRHPPAADGAPESSRGKNGRNVGSPVS